MKRVLAALALGLFGVLAARRRAVPRPIPATTRERSRTTGFVMPEQVDVQVFADYDKVFLDKVKQAGLWEIPSGELAEKKGLSEQTRSVGKLIAADHRVLDDDVKRVAARFGYTLPTKPTLEQQGWLDEINAASGKEFDRLFASACDFAHGLVYQAIADVRAHSRNQMMRAFAKQCEIFVNRHMSLLESTGRGRLRRHAQAVVRRATYAPPTTARQPLTAHRPVRRDRCHRRRRGRPRPSRHRLIQRTSQTRWTLIRFTIIAAVLGFASAGVAVALAARRVRPGPRLDDDQDQAQHDADDARLPGDPGPDARRRARLRTARPRRRAPFGSSTWSCRSPTTSTRGASAPASSRWS